MSELTPTPPEQPPWVPQPPSPNGVPRLPPSVVPYAAALVGVAATLMPFVPAHTILFKVCAAILGVGVTVGIASPGLRKK